MGIADIENMPTGDEGKATGPIPTSAPIQGAAIGGTDNVAPGSNETESKEHAQGVSMWAMGGANQLLVKRYGVELDDDTLQAGIERLTPVIHKWNLSEPPEWLKPYLDELRLGAFVAGVGFKVWTEVQKAKAEQAKSDDSQEAAADAAS